MGICLLERENSQSIGIKLTEQLRFEDADNENEKQTHFCHLDMCIEHTANSDRQSNYENPKKYAGFAGRAS